MDFEAAGDTEEVPKEQETVSEWTPKRWGSSQKSKRIKKPHQIGRRSRGGTVKSPKRASKPDRLDVKAAERHSEVHPPKKNHHITHQIIPTSRSPHYNHIFPSYPISISFTCGEYVKRYEEATGADRLHILNRTIEEIRKKTYMK